MANPSVEQAVERARAVQESRIASIRDLAKVRQDLADILEQVTQAERAAAAAYSSAVNAGWTADELRKIGYNEPAKKPRARRRAHTQTDS